jgi:hypothetical protein
METDAVVHVVVGNVDEVKFGRFLIDKTAQSKDVVMQASFNL